MCNTFIIFQFWVNSLVFAQMKSGALENTEKKTQHNIVVRHYVIISNYHLAHEIIRLVSSVSTNEVRKCELFVCEREANEFVEMKTKKGQWKTKPHISFLSRRFLRVFYFYYLVGVTPYMKRRK